MEYFQLSNIRRVVRLFPSGLTVTVLLIHWHSCYHRLRLVFACTIVSRRHISWIFDFKFSIASILYMLVKYFQLKYTPRCETFSSGWLSRFSLSNGTRALADYHLANCFAYTITSRRHVSRIFDIDFFIKKINDYKILVVLKKTFTEKSLAKKKKKSKTKN